MKNLLKADFFRLVKDKAALVGVIVAFAINLFVIGIYIIINGVASINGGDIGFLINGFSMFKGSFQVANNAGMVILIITVVILVKEFNQNNIRQKIIYGHSRTNIFFSNLIVYTVYSLGIMIATAFMNLLLGTLFFGSGLSGSVWANIADIFIALGINILVYLVFLFIVMFFGYLTTSIGGTIGITIGVTFGLTILLTFAMFLAEEYSWGKFLLYINPAYFSQQMMFTNMITLKESLYIVLSSLVYILGIGTGSLFIFKNKDIK